MTGLSEEETTSLSVKEGREKRVSFPPDEEMVSDFVDSRVQLQEGEMACYAGGLFRSVVLVFVYVTSYI